MGTKGTTPVTPPKEPKTENLPQSDRMHIHFAETAWRVAVPFMLFSLGGIKLDEWQDTSPLFSIIGVFLAITSVSFIIYKYVDKNFPDTFKKRGDK